MQTLQDVASPWQFTSPPAKSSCENAHSSFDLYDCTPGRLASTGLTRHTMLVNLGEPLAVSYSSDSGWKTFITPREAIICILPAGTRFEMSWTQEMRAVAFTCDEFFLKDAAGAHLTHTAQKWDVTDELLAGLAKRASVLATAPHFSERTYAGSLAVACASRIAGEHLWPQGAQLKGRLAPSQLSHVLAFAHDCMQLDIGLVDLANLVHLSPYHFGRLFKQTVGVSPYQYLLQLRIEFAKTLIVGRTGPLSDIAYQLNFSDQAHFSNAFRKATGVSPRQYLRQPIAE
jgi:AraC family transcriptional regulator